eukprot:m.78020 g.78020  ORF g.78020 m.78020 type:complete len:101 (+) comp16210_c0_seq1:102-404(+)
MSIAKITFVNKTSPDFEDPELFDLEIVRSTKIAELKQTLAAMDSVCVDAEHMKLIKEVTLSDDKTVLECEIKTGDKVQIARPVTYRHSFPDEPSEFQPRK